MKRIGVMMVVTIFILLVNLDVSAQTSENLISFEQKQPTYVAVNENMAVNLIFPFAIKRAQWVSSAISVQQFKGVDNILLLKANKKDFPLTNVSVVTTDNHFHSFVIGYSNELPIINLEYKVSADQSIKISKPDIQVNDADLQILSQKALREKSRIGKIGKNKYGISFSLEGIFIHQNTMFYRLFLKNHTNVQYDIDQLRFYVRDEKKAKRTASQEIELVPVYSLGNIPSIKGKTQETFVYALKKFTIPDQKFMTVEIMEKSGGRHLELKVKNSKILQADSL